MSFESKADYVVEQAKALAPKVQAWADFASVIFGQRDGVIAKAFPDEIERQLFYDSKQYKEVSKLRQQLIDKSGVVDGGTPEKSGRVLVRLPRSLHKAIDVEAKKEGVSANQLIVAKLTLPLRERLNLSIHLILEAYKRVFDGYSTDRVLVDPGLNAVFIAECRRLGMIETDYAINHALMDIRKSAKVELPKTTKRTEFRDYDEYQFASEIAVRLIQRSQGVSLDQILCDPTLLVKFDDLAKQLAPNQTAFKLRWAALNLRKTRKLGPMKSALNTSGHNVDLISTGPFRLLKPSDVPPDPGVYSLYDHTRPLFAGETANLGHRVQLHLAGQMPNWLGVTDDMECVFKYSPMPSAKASIREKWLLAFIGRERPLLNWQKSA